MKHLEHTHKLFLLAVCVCSGAGATVSCTKTNSLGKVAADSGPGADAVEASRMSGGQGGTAVSGSGVITTVAGGSSGSVVPFATGGAAGTSAPASNGGTAAGGNSVAGGGNATGGISGAGGGKDAGADAGADTSIVQKDAAQDTLGRDAGIDRSPPPACTGTLLLGNLLPTMKTGDSLVALGDLNGDGMADLVAGNGNGDALNVLLGKGDGTFAAKANLATNGGLAALGDVNGDGNMDVVVASYFANAASVFLGNGDGTFAARGNFATGEGPSALLLGDVNGDDKPDIVTADAVTNMASVLVGNGDGTFAARRSYAIGEGSSTLALGDVNGDGKPDLLAVSTGSLSGSPTSVSVLLGKGDGTLAAKTEFSITEDWSTAPLSVALGDVNGDSKLDLVVAIPYHDVSNWGALLLLLGQGDGTFAPPTSSTFGFSLPYA
jgi:hypothetical protein